jgi:hypothetical protein
MLRHLCDRCGADTTGKKSAAVSIVGDADIHGNGSVTRSADLCIPCRDALDAWLTASALLHEVDKPVVGRVLVDKKDLHKRHGKKYPPNVERVHRRKH